MRLTLRTLLAYLDGILDANDAQEIGKKAEESEFAIGLVHRIRDVMRRLRLGAPSLPEAGQEQHGHDRSHDHGSNYEPGLDPNTVAEYLDNTLASDRVTDFEKVCLDSDVHLAEVASCHQVLTLVLGEPVEVEPESRQRMYQLKDVPIGGKTPPPPPPASGAPGAPPVSIPLSLDLDDDDLEERKSRTKPTVPEYLREPRRRPAWLPIAAAVFLGVCALVVILKAFGMFEPGTFCGDLLVRARIVELPGKVATKTGEEEGKKDNEIPSGKPTAGTQSTPTAATASTATTSSTATIPATPAVPKAPAAIGPGSVASPTGSRRHPQHLPRRRSPRSRPAA